MQNKIPTYGASKKLAEKVIGALKNALRFLIANFKTQAPRYFYKRNVISKLFNS